MLRLKLDTILIDCLGTLNSLSTSLSKASVSLFICALCHTYDFIGQALIYQQVQEIARRSLNMTSCAIRSNKINFKQKKIAHKSWQKSSL